MDIYDLVMAGKFNGSGGGMGSADWNAAEGEPGHVLNRTHWVELTPVGGLPETTVDTSEGQGIINTQADVPVGGIYTVTYNGVAYECEAQDTGGMALLGDGTTMGLLSNGEPFLLMVLSAEEAAESGMSGVVMPLDGSTSATIKVEGYKKTVHKIDDEFLPTTPRINKDNKYDIDEPTLDSNGWVQMELDEADLAELRRVMNSGILMLGVPITLEGEFTVFNCPVTFISSFEKSYGSCNLPDGTFLRVHASTTFGTVSIKRVSALSL